MKNIFKNLGITLVVLIGSSFALGAYTPLPRMPPGMIFSTAATACPTYTIAADGASLLRSGTYAKLFTASGTTYGSADGTHFNVPNLKGVFPRGAGSQVISGITYSSTQGTAQGDQFQGHYHALTPNNPWVPGGTSSQSWTNTTAANNTYGQAVGSPTSDGVNGTPRTGSETRPSNLSVLYCIWY